MKILKKIMNKEGNGGYTLLFAVIVSSLVLVVGISILTISKKEFQLAASARDSTAAIYAADGALECFVYWDDKLSTPGEGKFYTEDSAEDIPEMTCGESIRTNAVVESNSNNTRTLVFEAKMAMDEVGGAGNIISTNTSCAIVTAVKNFNANKWKTTVESRGYNSGWNSSTNTCSDQSIKRVERALRLAY